MYCPTDHNPQEAHQPVPDVVAKLVISNLSERTLAQSMCVCRKFRRIAQEIARENFAKKWGVTLEGMPGPASAYLRCTEHNFSWKHVLCRQDTCESLALRFGLSTREIKRQNNIISDATIRSRTVLYLPWSDPTTIAGNTVTYEYDHHAKRSHFVVVTAPPRGTPSSPRAPSGCTALTASSPRHLSSPDLQREHVMATKNGRMRAVQVLCSALSIDPSSAEYYLECAGGNLRAAKEMYREDKEWEDRQSGVPRLGSTRLHVRESAGNPSATLNDAMQTQRAQDVLAQCMLLWP